MINNFNQCVENIQEKHFFIIDGDNQEPAFIVKENGEFEVINRTDGALKFIKKAETQIEATIQDFKDEEILKDKKLEAYVCLNCITQIDDTYEPITQQPENKDLRTYFELELDTIIDYTTKKEFN